jgi:hypothetical protein
LEWARPWVAMPVMFLMAPMSMERAWNRF